MNETPSVNSKRKQNGYSSTKLWAKRTRKRNEAYDRNEKYEEMTLREKLNYVRSLGGCKRQLARLEKLLATEKSPAVKPAPLTEAQRSEKVVKRSEDAVKAAVKSKSKSSKKV
jgi:hypothetical protein